MDKIDFLVELNNRGCVHIIANIIENFSVSEICTTIWVSKTWRRIVFTSLYKHISSNKVQKLNPNEIISYERLPPVYFLVKHNDLGLLKWLLNAFGTRKINWHPQGYLGCLPAKERRGFYREPFGFMEAAVHYERYYLLKYVLKKQNLDVSRIAHGPAKTGRFWDALKRCDSPRSLNYCLMGWTDNVRIKALLKSHPITEWTPARTVP